MEWLIYSMMASGAISSLSSMGMAQMGGDLEQTSIDQQLATIRAKSEEESIANMINLRQNIGSQIATQAARGTASNVGSAFALQEGSIQNFNKDERARKFNLFSQETQLKNAKYMSQMKQIGASSNAALGFLKNTAMAVGTSAYLSKKTPSSSSSGNAGSALDKYAAAFGTQKVG